MYHDKVFYRVIHLLLIIYGVLFSKGDPPDMNWRLSHICYGDNEYQ